MANELLTVFNASLSMAGVELLQKVNDNSAQSIHLLSVFDVEYDMALSEIPWNFAYMERSLVAVPEDDVPPDIEGEDLYWKPDDFVRMWWEVALTDTDDDINAEATVREEGGYLRGLYPAQRSGSTPKLVYIRRVRLPEATPRFRNILQLRLARSLTLQYPKRGSFAQMNHLLMTEKNDTFAMEVAQRQETRRRRRSLTAGNIFDLNPTRSGLGSYPYDYDDGPYPYR